MFPRGRTPARARRREGAAARAPGFTDACRGVQCTGRHEFAHSAEYVTSFYANEGTGLLKSQEDLNQTPARRRLLRLGSSAVERGPEPRVTPTRTALFIVPVRCINIYGVLDGYESARGTRAPAYTRKVQNTV